MTRPLVYLAGPIAGISGVDATDWRHYSLARLEIHAIECLSPMRAKHSLVEQEKISTNYHDYEKFGTFFTSKAIMARDFNDVRRCDVLLVNLLGAPRPSLGTVVELAWAFAMQKPAVVAIEAQGNPNDGHPLIHEAVPFRVETLDDAIDAVAVILNR